VNVIGHDDGDSQVKLPSVVMQTAVENNTSNVLRQDPTVVSAESDEVRFVVALNVR
jgi:hypothetical protein